MGQVMEVCMMEIEDVLETLCVVVTTANSLVPTTMRKMTAVSSHLTGVPGVRGAAVKVDKEQERRSAKYPNAMLMGDLEHSSQSRNLAMERSNHHNTI